MSDAPVSIIIRTLNSSRTLADSIKSVRQQSVASRIIVVDSGSTDGTLTLVESLADRVLHLEPGSFSYGRALNVGAAAAETELIGALSSHTVLPRRDWLATAVGHIETGAVATCGGDSDAAHEPLTAPIHADEAYLDEHPYWGFTNTANVFKRDVWRWAPFDESLVATEDQEWSWRAVRGGGYIVVDPQLSVSGGHRRTAGIRAYHRRMVREIRALEHLRPLQPYPLRAAAVDWARGEPLDPFISRTRRFGRTRLLDVVARWEAGAQATRGAKPQPRVESRAGGRDVQAN